MFLWNVGIKFISIFKCNGSIFFLSDFHPVSQFCKPQSKPLVCAVVCIFSCSPSLCQRACSPHCFLLRYPHLPTVLFFQVRHYIFQLLSCSLGLCALTFSTLPPLARNSIIFSASSLCFSCGVVGISPPTYGLLIPMYFGIVFQSFLDFF